MPLRPDLYRRLEQRFGGVTIAHEGEEREDFIIEDACEVDRHGRPRKRLEVVERGEEYFVTCPFCSDTRRRLSINHMFGWTGEPGVSYMHLAKCFNDCCPLEGNFGLKRQLYKMIFDDVGPGQQDFDGEKDPVLKGRRALRILPDAKPPGRVVRIDRYPEDHPAVKYLRKRGFDPAELYEQHNVCFCEEAKPEYAMAEGRIVVPVREYGRLVGWQGRLIGEPKFKYIPKFYSMPGMVKSRHLYNLDEARKYSHVVVVEGVFDAWRYGPEAVALLGKKASQRQCQLALAIGKDKPIVCMLDGDAASENQALHDVLRRSHPRVVQVGLADGLDPGSMPREALRAFAEQAAANQGWDFTPAVSAGGESSCPVAGT